MPNKLNLSAVEKYAKAFAGKICDDFFAQNNSIEGKQILSVSSIQQVNLLTIKALFEKWQGETQRLRSPYFNYESQVVQDALKNFMNTVSQFISVKREHFEPLLIDATAETLVLATEPDIYFKEALRDLPGFRLTTESLKGLSKYIQINKGVLEKLGEKLGSQEFVFANQAMTWVEEICAKGNLEDSDKYLSQFAQVVPLSDELLGKQPVVEAPVSQAPVSFFDQELTTIVRAKEPEPVVQARVEFPKIEEPVIEPPRIEPRIEQPVIERPVEVVRAAVVEAVMPEIKPKEVEDQRLNDKFNHSETLNDKVVHAEKTLLDVHQSTKIGDITSAISLNQRFLFTNNLFAGNIQAFNHALEELELCKDFSEAKELLLKKYVPKYLWDITSAEAEEFIDIIKRRFN
ncbi:MAG: hypothetical protein ACK4NY_20390 [Spirosomataceae bacterium]